MGIVDARSGSSAAQCALSTRSRPVIVGTLKQINSILAQPEELLLGPAY